MEPRQFKYVTNDEYRDFNAWGLANELNENVYEGYINVSDLEIETIRTTTQGEKPVHKVTISGKLSTPFSEAECKKFWMIALERDNLLKDKSSLKTEMAETEKSNSVLRKLWYGVLALLLIVMASLLIVKTDDLNQYFLANGYNPIVLGDMSVFTIIALVLYGLALLVLILMVYKMVKAKKNQGRVLDMAAKTSLSVDSINKQRSDLWKQYPQEIRDSEFSVKGNVVYNKYISIDIDQRKGDFKRIKK